MPIATPSPRQNHLLAALPGPEFRKLLPHLEMVQLDLGQTLHESGGTLNHVYFPTTAIVSLLYVMEDGASAEIAVVGNDGIVGIALFMGGGTMPNRAVVHGCAARGRDRGRRKPAACRVDRLQPGADHRPGSTGPGSAGVRMVARQRNPSGSSRCSPCF